MAVLMSSCMMNVGGPDVEPYFPEVFPAFKEGDIYAYHYKVEGISASDYYCFTSATEGTVVTTLYTDVESLVDAENTFSYNSTNGEISINGKYWITLIHAEGQVLDFVGGVYGYNKANALRRESGKQGLYATFSNGTTYITFKPKGKAIFKSSDTEISCEYENDNGKITVRNANNYSDELVFLYFPNGYLMNDQAFSNFDINDKVTLHMLLDDSDVAAKNVEYITESLPDNFSYLFYNLSEVKGADLNTVKSLLVENPKKKFYFYSMNFTEKEIPSEFFRGIDNLCEIPLPMVIGDRAFMDCCNLEEIVGMEFTSIGESAFEGCTSLKNISLNVPYGKTMTIGKNAFKGCSSMTYAKFYEKRWEVTKDGNTISIFSEIDLDNVTNNVKLLTETYVDYEWEGEHITY